MVSDKIKQQQIQFLKTADQKAIGGSQSEMVAWTGSHLLYWGKRIDALQLAQDRVKLIVKNTINLILILIAVGGFLMLGWAIYLMRQSGIEIWNIYRVRAPQLFFFWLTLLFDTYLFYRLKTEFDKFKHIPKRDYQLTTPTFQPISELELKTLNKDRRIDISQYFTFEAIGAVQKAWQLANKYKHAQTQPVHLLVSLLAFDQANIVFSRLGISFESLKNRITKSVARLEPKVNQPVRLSESLYQILFSAYFSAWQLRQRRVDLTELLEALAEEIEQNEVYEIFYDLGIDTDKVTNVVAWLRIKRQLRENWQRFRGKAALKPKNNMDRAMTAIATPILNTFAQDLTLLARSGYLLPCIGREKELQEIFQIMQGGTRRSVVLIGHPGVGRQTIIEGIAQMMVEENVPPFLQDKRLVVLNVAKLVSGVPPAIAQERLLAVLNEIRRSGNIVLVVSDIHNMVGISAGGPGSIDLAGTLAQILAANSILTIASSNPKDYRRYIEGKSELENVLEPIVIKEVSGNEAIQILEAKAGAIEYQNNVYFSYDAIAQTVNLSSRYLHDRYLPEKAIEIMQEVAVKTKDAKGKNALVTANDVATVISNKTNIPLTEITQEESEKLLGLEDQIHQRIVDQQEAVNMVASSLRRARAEMRDAKRPIVNLLFLGPTGVGKTELAKTVAEVYFKAEKNMIRIDMSEYQDKPSVNRLIGAPPGYGNDEGGQLTEAVRKNPFSLILFDEIEKAHPDVLNILLQVMDDGRLTDSVGRTIDFTNSIIIGTSNAGTQFIQEGIRANKSVEEIRQQLIDQQLQQYFRPEFLNRFDGIIVFKPLSMADVQAIAKLMIKQVASSLEAKGAELEISPEALVELAQAGFDPTLGARPLRRVIQDRVQDVLANYLISGKIGRRDKVIIDPGIQIRVEKAQQF